MAGISHNAKNSNLPEFGDSVSAGSKALCGLTEAAAQVKIITGIMALTISEFLYTINETWRLHNNMLSQYL